MSDLELLLERPAHGGYTVARHDGKAFFVRGGLPGERVRARITQDKKRFAFAEVVEVIEPSPERVEPPCPIYGVCGGCQWQHASYAEQLRIKQAVVVEQFARVAGLPNITVHPTIPSAQPFAYRVHATFHGSKAGTLGFVGMDDHKIIPVERCPILRDDLNAAFARFKMRRMLFPPEMRLRMQIGDDGSVTSARMSASEYDDDAFGLPGGQADAVYYHVKGRRFRCTAGAFFQVNSAQAEVLIDQALARLDLRGGETVLDLYSGGGLFSAFIAPTAGQVIAVESAPLAIEDARYNLAEFSNIDQRVGTVETALPIIHADAALVDPPRAGMKPAALDALLACEPVRIAYVSCDPATLARDARRLVESGYTVTDVQPVDMFPQTYHVESVARFVRL